MRDYAQDALAIYWFGTLAHAVERQDWILATVARDKLRELGWDVRTGAKNPRPRKSRIPK